MPRPLKPQSMRQRRNKASTRAALPAKAAGVRAPALPIRGCSCGGPPPPPVRRKGQRGRPRKPRVTCPDKRCDGSGVVPWNPQVQAWWSRLWSSPMAIEFIESDLDALFMLASLKDEFWSRCPGNGKLAGEIRQEEARFGLTPLDRRRLEWGLEPPEEHEPDAPAPAPPPEKPREDPRNVLRMVRPA